MKKHLSIIGLSLFLLVGCTYPPSLKVLVQNKGTSYEWDHRECLERARLAWPCTESQLRAPIAEVVSIAHLRLRHQKVMVIHCLERKGYSIVNIKEQTILNMPLKLGRGTPLKPSSIFNY